MTRLYVVMKESVSGDEIDIVGIYDLNTLRKSFDLFESWYTRSSQIFQDIGYIGSAKFDQLGFKWSVYAAELEHDKKTVENKNIKKLWKYGLDCGRMGDIEGLFIATDQDIEYSSGCVAHFGEALGKHSQIWDDNFTKDSLELISDDQEKIAWLETVFKNRTISGYNPLNYIECEHCYEPRYICKESCEGYKDEEKV